MTAKREDLSLAERLAPLQRLDDPSYLDAFWDNYQALRYRELCGVVMALFDPDGRALPGEMSIAALDYGCSSGAMFRALEEHLGSKFRLHFIGIDSDWRASGFLRAKMPAVEFHEADVIRLEEIAAEGRLSADVCIAMCHLYAHDEGTARRVIAAFSAIAPYAVIADQIDNAGGTGSAVLELTDHAGRPYQATCHPYSQILAASGYIDVTVHPAAEPYKSITGYVVASKGERLPSRPIAAALAEAPIVGRESTPEKMTSFGAGLGDFLRANKLACMDVGAAGGVHALWRPYGEFIEVDAFEPNEDSCRQAAAASEPFVHWHPVALSAATGTQPFYVLNATTGSSFYPPNDEVQKFLNDSSYRRVTRIIDIDTLSIPDFLLRFERPMPNLIKLDTQGSELDILRSIGDSRWPEVLAIEVEVEFIEVYRKQPLFCDVDGFLRSKGMLLFDLRTAREYCCAHDEVAHYLKKYCDFQAGRSDMSARLYAGDALYIRDAFSQPPTSRVFLLKLIAALVIYLYFDYAIYFCDVGLTLGLIDKAEHEAVIAEIVAGTPKARPADPEYQAFWQFRGWPNQ